MSAANPLPGSGTTEKRAYEPSMEEILASIRRIIADDQSLPKHPSVDSIAAITAGEPIPQWPSSSAPSVAEPVTFPELRPSVLSAETVASAPAPASDDVPEVAPSAEATRSQLRESEPAAHAPIAAPQFPTPPGPVGDAAATMAPSYDPRLMPGAFDLGPPSLADTLAATAPQPASSVRELHPSDDLESFDVAPSSGEEEVPYETPIEPPRLRRPAPHLFSEETDSSVSSAFNLLAASRLADNSDELLNLAREMIKPLLRVWLDDNLPSMVERMVRAEIERVARGNR